MDAEYNDVQEWRYKDLLAAFGADPKESATYQVKTKQELEDLFNNKEFSSAPYIQLVEVYMSKKDAPRAMVMTTEAAARNNARK